MEGWGELDQDALLSCVTDDIEVEDPALMGEPCRGRDAYREFLSDTLIAFPDSTFTVDDAPFLALDGSQLIQPWTASGTFAGPLRVPGTTRTLAPTGRAFRMPGVDVYAFRGEQICRLRSIYDGMSVSQQIGLLPGPRSPLFRRVAPMLQPLAAALMRRSRR